MGSRHGPRAVAHVAPMRGLWAGFLLSALVLANAEQVAAAAAPGGAAQAAQPSYHVVVVHNSDEVTVESIVSVITDKLGAVSYTHLTLPTIYSV